MPHCTQCGTMVAEGAAYCQSCGQPTSVAPVAAQSGLSENAAGGLSYVLGWLTGLIFLLIDKRPYVRFHAAQSLVVFGMLHILRIAWGMMFGFSWFFDGPAFWTRVGIAAMVSSLFGLVVFVLWVVLIVKAFQGERFRLPIAADLADSLAGR